MVGIKFVQFFLFISLMILSTHALNVLLTDGIGKFSYETEIRTCYTEKGRRRYAGCSKYQTFTPRLDTTKVIVHIKSGISEMNETLLNTECERKRHEIAVTLSRHHYQLLYLGVDECNVRNLLDERVVGQFLIETIKREIRPHGFAIVTIGDDTDDINLRCIAVMTHVPKYIEEEGIYGRNLQGELSSMSA